MAVSSVSSAASLVSVDPAAQAPIGNLGTLPDATQSTISTEGGLFGELDALAKQDPSKFKEVSQEIADKLQEEASAATGKKAQFLSTLAERFGEAAKTGDAASLKPDRAQGGKGHHGGHHHQRAASSSSGDAGQPSPFDTVTQIIQQSLQAVSASSASAT